MEPSITFNKEDIAAFCEKHHIIKFAFFGSVLTERFREDSDVDVLVEFDPDHGPNLIDVVRMERELSEMFGRKADMRTAEDLSRLFREEVVRTALVQYAA